MMIPQFIRFYQGYTVSSAMSEYAVTFFSLVNAMLRIKSEEQLNMIQATALPHMEKSDQQSVIRSLSENTKGLDDVIKQAKVIKNVN